jgi:hypothetical protein
MRGSLTSAVGLVLSILVASLPVRELARNGLSLGGTAPMIVTGGNVLCFPEIKAPIASIHSPLHRCGRPILAVHADI